jgi:hypothetical protein
MSKAQTQTDALTDAETLALAKVIKDKAGKAARSNVESGQKHKVDFRVRIHGVMDIGADRVDANAQKARPWLLAAVALSAVNEQTRQSIETRYGEMLAALNSGDASEAKRIEAETKKQADMVCARLKLTASVNVKGSVRGNLEVERLED